MRSSDSPLTLGRPAGRPDRIRARHHWADPGKGSGDVESAFAIIVRNYADAIAVRATPDPKTLWTAVARTQKGLKGRLEHGQQFGQEVLWPGDRRGFGKRQPARVQEVHEASGVGIAVGHGGQV